MLLHAISPLFLKHCGIGHLKNSTAPWFETLTVQIAWKK